MWCETQSTQAEVKEREAGFRKRATQWKPLSLCYLSEVD